MHGSCFFDLVLTLECMQMLAASSQIVEFWHSTTTRLHMVAVGRSNLPFLAAGYGSLVAKYCPCHVCVGGLCEGLLADLFEREV